MEEQLKQLKSNFWIMGIPYGDFKIRIRYFVFSIWLWLMLVSEMSFIVSSIKKVNLLEITYMIPCSCIGILCCLKILVLTLKRRKVYNLTESLSKLFDVILSDPANENLIKSKLMLTNFINKYLSVLNFVLVVIYTNLSLITMLTDYFTNNEWVFKSTYSLLLPFEVNSWLSWFVVYIYSVGSGYICILYLNTFEILYCVLSTHVCVNFAVISQKINKLGPSDIDGLKQLIKEHQNILELSNDLEDIFTAPNLFNVVISSIEICALGMNLTMGDISEVPGCLLFLFSVLLQIFLMSVYGDNIITESSKIGMSVYNSKWYEMDNKSKKIVHILMTRCHKPQILTAYKFSTMGYGSFNKILSTSWSYFTILRTVYTPPEANNIN